MTRKKSCFRKKISFIVSFLLITALFVLFFPQFSYFVSANQDIKECESKIKELSQENENLETNLVESNHLNNVNEIAQTLNFEKAEKVHYIKVISGVVVSK